MSYCAPFPRGTRVSQEYKSNPGQGANPAGGHTGRDYAVDVGTPIHAAADGVIVHSSWFGDWWDNEFWLTRMGGDTTVLRADDGKVFVYAHESDSTLGVGTRVRKGEIIALSGNSGTATTGPHCHVEQVPDRPDFQNGTYGRERPDFTEYPEDITLQLTAASTGTTESDEDMALSYEDKLFIQNEIERRAVVTRQVIVETVTNAAFDLKKFTQKTDNENADRGINDARDQTAKLMEYFEKQGA